MAVYMTAQFKVRLEGLARCQEAIREFVAYVKNNERETRLYVSMHEVEDEASFQHFFIFENQAAQERHANSEAVKRFTNVLYPETLVPVEFASYTVLATTEG
jgi:quinol monooxygenase YgiN